jgi:hypothetical protein
LNDIIKAKVVAHLSQELGAVQETKPLGYSPFHADHCLFARKWWYLFSQNV